MPFTKKILLSCAVHGIGMKRHFSDPPSQEEPSTKQARNTDVQCHLTFDFTDECNTSPRTPVKAKAMVSAKIASPSPRKISKPIAQKTAQSPEWCPASPIQTTSVASPRRKRGGELSKEFKVMGNIIKLCLSQFSFNLYDHPPSFSVSEFVWVMENLESHGILEFHIPGR